MSELTPEERERLNGVRDCVEHEIMVTQSHVDFELMKIGQLLDAADERDRLREALTPSAETKAAYIGEFTWETACRDGEGVDTHVVPWTTIKEIMAAILARATAAIAAARKETP